MRPNRLARWPAAGAHGNSGGCNGKCVNSSNHSTHRGGRNYLIKGVLGAMLSMGLASCSTSVPPTTPATAASADLSLAQLLLDAEHSDRLNAQLYSRSAPSLDHYYNLKADEVNDVMRRLQRGENVPSDDINHALDNSLASTFGVPVN